MSHARANQTWPKWALPGLAVLALLAHGLSLANEFTNWDDPALVTQNPHIQSLDLSTILSPVPGLSYQPIRELSHAIDLAIWGKNPLGHHAFNLLLHIGATLLLALLIARLLRDSEHPDAIPIALVVAGLFAVHPVNVEAVAWVSSRKYGLVAVGIFGCCLAHLCGHRKSALALAVFAMLSSPFGIILPALLVTLDFCRYGKFAKTHWPGWLPVAISTTLMFLLMSSTLLAENSLARQGNVVATGLPQMGRSLFDSILHLLFPVNLGVRYLNSAAEFADWRVWTAILGPIAITVWALKRGNRLVLTGLLWFGICWAPVSGLVPISTFVADRYCYLSAVGLFLALAAVANSAIWQRVFAVVLAVFTVMSMARTRVWRNSETLWRAEIARQSDHEIARYNLALALLAKEETEEAEDHLRAAIDIRASYIPPYLVLGQRIGGPAGLDLLRKAVELAPNNPMAAAAFGESLLRAEAHHDAAAALKRAIALQPDLIDAYPLLAKANLRLGQFDEGLRVIDHALAYEPNAPYLRVMRGLILAEGGSPQLALAEFSQAQDVATAAIVRLLRRNARRVFVERQWSAISAFETALLLQPDDADLLAEFASALFQGGEIKKAIAIQQRAVDLVPTSAEYLANLGGMLAIEKRFEDALVVLERALALYPKHKKARSNLERLRRDMKQ
jgi:tetratricopeptide (TPR) repeat protein